MFDVYNNFLVLWIRSAGLSFTKSPKKSLRRIARVPGQLLFTNLVIKRIWFLIVLLVPEYGFGQLPVIDSKKYSWIAPSVQSQKDLTSAILFEGSAHDMEFLQMSANTIRPSKNKTVMLVPENEEHLLVVKNGKLNIAIRDSAWSVAGGSIGLMMPGEKYSIRSDDKEACTFYLMKYRSKSGVDLTRSKSRSFVKDWNKIAFKPHNRGGIRNFFEIPTPMSERFEMHVTTLNEGLKSHEPHTHEAEEIVLIIDNKTEMQIGDKFFKGGPGDIYYLGSNVPHAIRNDGKGTCTYFAFQFE
jgi:(S)-ureidoglycine aminohydrolase